MLDDDQIRQMGGTEEDIARYAHDVGYACGAIYGGTCDYCGETDTSPMTPEEYYIAPAQQIFDDIKQAAIQIWNQYDDTHGYRTEKLSRITDLQNISDNAWYMVAMFDTPNQNKLLTIVTPETAEQIRRARGY